MYHWFAGASYERVTKELVAAPGGRLEVRVEGDQCYLRVIPKGVTYPQEINESFPCPPICPE